MVDEVAVEDEIDLVAGAFEGLRQLAWGLGRADARVIPIIAGNQYTQGDARLGV
jgi:hypothetical protein